MHIVDPALDRYLDHLAEHDDPILREMESLAASRDFPIVGPQVGRLLHLLAASIGARRVLELGSGFGYSAYWFARAVGANGSVILTEGDAERAAEARRFLARAGFDDRTDVRVGNGLEIARGLGGSFDVVFNDVDKQDYGMVLALAAGLLRPGGLLISDNMLWSGRVLDDTPEDSTRGVLQLTRALKESPDFDTAVVPLRDGLSISLRSG